MYFVTCNCTDCSYITVDICPLFGVKCEDVSVSGIRKTLRLRITNGQRTPLRLLIALFEPSEVFILTRNFVCVYLTITVAIVMTVGLNVQ